MFVISLTMDGNYASMTVGFLCFHVFNFIFVEILEVRLGY